MQAAQSGGTPAVHAAGCWLASRRYIVRSPTPALFLPQYCWFFVINFTFTWILIGFGRWAGRWAGVRQGAWQAPTTKSVPPRAGVPHSLPCLRAPLLAVVPHSLLQPDQPQLLPPDLLLIPVCVLPAVDQLPAGLYLPAQHTVPLLQDRWANCTSISAVALKSPLLHFGRSTVGCTNNSSPRRARVPAAAVVVGFLYVFGTGLVGILLLQTFISEAYWW